MVGRDPCDAVFSMCRGLTTVSRFKLQRLVSHDVKPRFSASIVASCVEAGCASTGNRFLSKYGVRTHKQFRSGSCIAMRAKTHPHELTQPQTLDPNNAHCHRPPPLPTGATSPPSWSWVNGSSRPIYLPHVLRHESPFPILSTVLICPSFPSLENATLHTARRSSII